MIYIIFGSLHCFIKNEGSKSIIECSLSKTPIVSTDVGVAEILSPKSIYKIDDFENTLRILIML